MDIHIWIMSKPIYESNKKLFDTSVLICLVENWLPEIAH